MTNYKQKYLKYKTKYLKLKGAGCTGSKCPEKPLNERELYDEMIANQPKKLINVNFKFISNKPNQYKEQIIEINSLSTVEEILYINFIKNIDPIFEEYFDEFVKKLSLIFADEKIEYNTILDDTGIQDNAEITIDGYYELLEEMKKIKKQRTIEYAILSGKTFSIRYEYRNIGSNPINENDLKWAKIIKLQNLSINGRAAFQSITKLNNCIELDCSTNYTHKLDKLPELPECIKLNCSLNNLKELPDLPKCVDLDCSYNQLEKLPELPNCKKLDCSYNELKHLPELPECEYLNYSNNEIEEIPELPKIKNIINQSK